MGFFNFDLRKVALIALVMALPLISINMQKAPDELPWYQRALHVATSRVQGTFRGFTQGVRRTTQDYLNLVAIKRRNRELQEENDTLMSQMAVFEEVRRENERLSHMLSFRSRAKLDLVAARVISRDPLPDIEGLLIDRGSEDGLTQGAAVITPHGVVGYVARLDARSASVRVLTDRLAVIDGVVQRTRARGIVEGKNRTTCRLRYIERAVDVAVGDLVVTTGLAGFFPPGFPIGKVTSVEETKFGVSQKVDVEPLVHPSTLEEVFVIRNPGGQVLAPVSSSLGPSDVPQTNRTSS